MREERSVYRATDRERERLRERRRFSQRFQSSVSGSLLVLILLVLMAIQARSLYLRIPPVEVPVSEGQSFPVTVRNLEGKPLLQGRGCVVLVLCTTSCVYCKARAADRARYEANASFPVIWVIWGSRAVAAQFASEHAFDTAELGLIDPTEMGSSFLRHRRLSIPGTPLTVVLDGEGTVRDVALAAELPTGPEMDAFCRVPGSE